MRRGGTGCGGAPHFTAKTAYSDNSGKFEFEAWLPPDEYDVYIEPPADSKDIGASSCTVVPQLVHGIKVEAGDVELPIPLQAPKLLEVEVLLPAAGVTTADKTPLANWEIDVIDPATGLVLSAPAMLKLVADPTDVLNQHYFASVEYAEAVGEGAGAGKELVRLRPPAGADKPTLVLERAAQLDPLAEAWLFVDGARSTQAALPTPKQEVNILNYWRKSVKVGLPPSTEEYAVSIAASLGRHFLRLSRAVGLVSAGSHLTLLPPDRGGRQLGKILEALALLRAEGELPIRGLVETQAKHIPKGSTVVLITPTEQAEFAIVVQFF